MVYESRLPTPLAVGNLERPRKSALVKPIETRLRLVHTNMILDNPLLARLIFFPRPIRTTPTFSVEVDGGVIGCHLRKPYPDAGIVVHFHGNAESAAECNEYLADFFLDMGV